MKRNAIFLTLGMLLIAGLLCSCGFSGEKSLEDELGLSDDTAYGSKKDDDAAAEEVRKALEFALAEENIYEKVCRAKELEFYVTIDNQDVIELQGLDDPIAKEAVLKDIGRTIRTYKNDDISNLGVRLTSKERTKEGSMCWIQAKYNDTRLTFEIRYMDNAGQPTDKVTWDGRAASDENAGDTES